MSSDEEMVQINVQVPRRTKELAKKELDYGGLSRTVRQTLHQVAHGGQVSERERVEDQLEELRDERRKKKRKRDRLNDELDQLEIKIERAEQRLDELRDKESQYEAALQTIEERMHNQGMHVFADHGQVERAAELGGCSPTAVLEDLRDRNPELDDDQFSEAVVEHGGGTDV